MRTHATEPVISPPPLPYARQWLDETDIAAVVEVLRSPWITQGPKVPEFERRVADYCGAKHAVAVAEDIYSRCVSLPPYPGLSEVDVSRVIDTACAILSGAP